MEKIAPSVPLTWLNDQSGQGQEIAYWGDYGVDQFAFFSGTGYGDGADDEWYGNGDGDGTSRSAG